MGEEFKEMRFTPDELKIIKDTYGGNPELLKILRKVFLPEYDSKAPIGQTVHLFQPIAHIKKLPPQDRENVIMNHLNLIEHVEFMLMQLHLLANINEETPEQKALREKQDSSK